MTRHAKDTRTDAERAGDEFDALIKASEERADRKRAAREYPYGQEESA